MYVIFASGMFMHHYPRRRDAGEPGLTLEESYRGFELEFSSDQRLVVIRCPERRVLDQFDTNRFGCRDELRSLARARIDEELGDVT
jgi:hypothetical protein